MGNLSAENDDSILNEGASFSVYRVLVKIYIED